MKTETEIDRVRLHEKRSPPGNQHRRERSRSQRSRRRRRPVPRIRRRSVVRSESRGRPKKIEIPEVQVNHREAVQRGGDREAGPGIEIGGGGGELRLQVRPRAQSSRKKEERARSVKQTQLRRQRRESEGRSWIWEGAVDQAPLWVRQQTKEEEEVQGQKAHSQEPGVLAQVA